MTPTPRMLGPRMCAYGCGRPVEQTPWQPPGDPWCCARCDAIRLDRIGRQFVKIRGEMAGQTRMAI